MNLTEELTRYGQEHLLRFEAQLTSDQREQLHRQLAQIDFAQLQRLTDNRDETVDWSASGQSRCRLRPCGSIASTPDFSSQARSKLADRPWPAVESA